MKPLPECLLLSFLIAVPAVRGQQPAQPSTAPLPPPSREEFQEFYGGHLQRSMALFATSSKERRWPVRVLIYGQSIVGSKTFTNYIESDLRLRYPWADLTLENRAIGGFGADRLVRTAVHDVYPFYPDLVIFHVYGGEKTGELERIFANIRRYTTADILLFNHHQNNRELSVPPFAPKFFRYLAERYDMELADISREWPRYLEENHLVPQDMLRDSVHPTPEGWKVMTTLIARHLIYNPLYPGGSWKNVRRYEAKRAPDEGVLDEIVFTGKPWKVEPEGAVGADPSSGLRLRFEGNRVDVITAHVKGLTETGTARVLLDGKPVSASPGVYAVTLPSKGPGTWFPAIKRVSYEKPLIEEDWTLKVTKISQDAQDIEFEVTGSKTGPDGKGSSRERFVSSSGRVVIEGRDWMLADIMKIFKQTEPPPVGYEVTWKVVPMFVDTFKPPVAEDPAKVYATTVAQGFANGAHTLEIVPNGDGPVPVEAIQVYCPPLR